MGNNKSNILTHNWQTEVDYDMSHVWKPREVLPEIFICQCGARKCVFKDGRVYYSNGINGTPIEPNHNELMMKSILL